MKSKLNIFSRVFFAILVFSYTALWAQPHSIKATWDWEMPKKNETEQREFVRFAEECGFNTVIIAPTPAIIDEAHSRKMLVFDVLIPIVSKEFADQHPDCMQRMQSFEESMVKILYEAPYETFNKYVMQSHQEFNTLYSGNWVCFEHEESVQELCRMIGKKFDAHPIDGIALDVFGFKNMYACFCSRCDSLRKEIKAKNPDRTDEEILASFSEESLIRISQRLYDYVKSIQPKAIVTCHIYPNFNPNPYYGNRFKVDYCGQTIAWFFKPFWDLDEVAFRAKRYKALEDTRFNHFMPFIACFGRRQDYLYLKKSPEQLRQEFFIAREYGGGNVMFATLGSLKEYQDLFESVSGVLKKQWD